MRPVYGTVAVAAQVESGGAPLPPGLEITLVVDGQAAATLRQPPFEWSVDVGQENRPHRFEVVARARGVEASAWLETPAFRVDQQVDVDLQQVYVTALAGDGRVMDLGREDFHLEADGERQKLITFERGDVPMTACLLVDASDSMQGARLQAALDGAHRFIRGMGPLDQVSLELFSDLPLFSSPFTNIPEVLFTSLGPGSARGGTAINDALYRALKRLEVLPGRRVVILLSDGVDTTSVLDMEDVLPAVQRSGALLYWIRIGKRSESQLPSSTWRDAPAIQKELKRLTEAVEGSGGRVVPLPEVGASEGAFAEILAELRDQYVLGFYPPPGRGRGRWHRLRVKVRRDGVEVRANEGYMDW
jgi:Ca-activated chloride channel family protein